MRVEVKYRALWVAIFLAALFVALYLFNFYSTIDTSYNAVQQLNAYAQGSILGEALLWFQQSFPVLNSIVVVVMLFVGGLTLNEFTIRNNLFGVATKLPSIIYVLVCLASCTTPIITIPAMAAMLISLAFYSLYKSSKSRQYTLLLFLSCVYMGMIPLLYPSTALILPIWVFAMLVVNSNTYRDAATAYIGVALPLVVGVTIKWLVGGGSFAHEWAMFINSTIAHSPYGVDWLSITSLFIIVAAAVSIVGLMRLDSLSMRYSLRQLIKSANIWLFLSLALVAIPSFSFEVWVIMSTPVSLLITVALLHVRSGFRSISILTLLIACFVANALRFLVI